MKIHIKHRPYDWKIGDDKWIELQSVWNSSQLIELSFNGVSFIVNGYDLIESIKRIIGRPFGTTD
jgi:hypothetical protein